MKLLDYFDQVYVINLTERTDRREEIAVELRRIGLDLKHPQIKLFPAVRPVESLPFPSIGAHGCFMSHLGVLADACLSGFERILVFEDDLNFIQDFAQRIEPLLDNLANTSWSVFYGGYRISSEVKLRPANDMALIPPDVGVETAHFIGFQKPAIGMVLDYLTAMRERKPGDPEGGPMHVDGAFSWFRRDNSELVTIGACPELGYQRPSRSDIFILGWKDKIPLIRVLVRLARKLKNLLLRK